MGEKNCQKIAVGIALTAVFGYNGWYQELTVEDVIHMKKTNAVFNKFLTHCNLLYKKL